MSGRDYELWQPLLALAVWLEQHGAAGLPALVVRHAARLIALSKEDSTPDAEEALLRVLADAVQEGRAAWTTPADLLQAATERDPSFAKWSSRSVAAALKRYGLASTKTNGRRTYREITADRLRRVEVAYGVDLGLANGPNPAPEPVPAGPADPADPDLEFPGPLDGPDPEKGVAE